MTAYGRKTSEDLITSIKKRSGIPEHQKTFEDLDILRFANEEMDNVLIPLILRVKEEFYVRTESFQLTAGQTRVKIPYRAVGSKIRNIFLEDSSGSRRSLSRIQPEDVGEFSYGDHQGSKGIFYLEGDEVVFVSPATVNDNDFVKISFYLKPNDLTTDDRVPTITLIEDAGASTNLYLSSLPDHFQIGDTVDFIEDERNHKILDYDIALTDVDDDVSGEVRITIATADLPDELQVGDHVAISGETKVPQLPADLHAMLCQAAACRMLEAQGDSNLEKAEKTLTKMMDAALSIIDTRTEGNPQKILNTGGFLRRKRYIG
jgi:hypothetical protein